MDKPKNAPELADWTHVHRLDPFEYWGKIPFKALSVSFGVSHITQKLVLAELGLDTAQKKTTLQHLGHAVCLRSRDPAMSMSSPCQKRCPYVQLGHMPRFHNVWKRDQDIIDYDSKS